MAAQYKVNHLPAPEQLTVSQVGHVYQLGRHRLVCGPPHYLRRVLGDGHVTLYFTDLPGIVRGSASNQEGGVTPASDYALFSAAYDMFDVMKWVSAPDARAYVFTPWEDKWSALMAAEMLGVPVAQFLAWNHGDQILSEPSRSSDELCFVFKTGMAPTIRVRKRAANAKTVVPRLRPGLPQLGEKPVELFASILTSHTKQGDLVMESRIAQPATLAAAEMAGRIYAGAGQPFMIDAAIREWQRFTASSAYDVTAGYSFDERALEISKKAS